MTGRAFFVVAMLLSGAAAAQAPAADPVGAGHALALQICSACHVVGPDQHFRPLLLHPAPSFVSIAARPATTLDSVRAFINSRHEDIVEPGRMPNPSLLDYQVDQVASYIASLKPAAPPARPRR